MNYQTILDKLPYTEPFLFVNELLHIDENGAKGTYTFSKRLDFYTGHFKNNPITPGVILTECCAQIGLVCLGIYLLAPDDEHLSQSLSVGFSSSEMEFFLTVRPGEKVVVTSEKIYFRFHKLKCKVKMHDSGGKLICKGILSGMLKKGEHE